MAGVSIKGLGKADVLAALYNASKPQGKGFMHYDPTPMTKEVAKEIIDRLSGRELRFDYLAGRVMKVDISKDEFDPWGYDRDNGKDAADMVILALRRTGCVNPAVAQAVHQVNTRASIEDVRKHLGDETKIEKDGNTTVFHLGLSDMAEHLRPAIDKAEEDLNK